MKKTLSKLQTLLRQSSQLVIKTFMLGIVFSAGIVLVFAFSIDDLVPNEKKVGDRLSTAEWNLAADKINAMWADKLAGYGGSGEPTTEPTDGDPVPESPTSTCSGKGQSACATESECGWENGSCVTWNLSQCTGIASNDATVQIGSQIWSKCNSIVGNGGIYTDHPSRTPLSASHSPDANAKLKGKLYRTSERFLACPSGWRLPSNSEAQTLINLGGMNIKEGTPFNGILTGIGAWTLESPTTPDVPTLNFNYDKDSDTAYWTSHTAIGDTSCSDFECGVWSFELNVFNSTNARVNMRRPTQHNAYKLNSVRCIKE